MILGDSNLPNINWNHTKCSNATDLTFLDCIFENDLKQYFHVPTRGKNKLDLVLGKNLNGYIDDSLMLPLVHSDLEFLNIALQIEYINTAPSHFSYTKILDFNKANFYEINKYLNSINWYLTFSSCKNF